jgi:hypothetical protein
MSRLMKAGVLALVLTLCANVAAAQPAATPPARDSLWNGALIGLGAGVGSAATLDAVSCDNGFGGCDFPWAAYLTLAGIGAGTGAAIDFLIGRRPVPRTTTLTLAPLIGQGRKGIVASLDLGQLVHTPRLRRPAGRRTPERE